MRVGGDVTPRVRAAEIGEKGMDEDDEASLESGLWMNV